MFKIINSKVLITFLMLFVNMALSAQSERKHIRDGNKKFTKENFEDSEVAYRKALETDPASYNAAFNLGDALFRQEKYDEAVRQFSSIAEIAPTKEDKAKVLHNIGNSLVAQQKLEEGIDAYKAALRNNPQDMETKYNLAWAQDKLKNQEQQQQNKDQQQDQDQDQNKDQNKDQQQQDQQQQQQQQQQDQQQQQQQQDEQQEQQDQQQEPRKDQISKEDAQRILEALQLDEQKVQEKLKKEQAKARKVKIEKDW